MRFTDTDITICCLCYGDYPQLAARMLTSIRKHFPAGHTELRIGLNEVSAATKEQVDVAQPDMVLDSPTNRHKYPVMRDLFYDQPLLTRYVMWFDDDSYIHENAPANWQQMVLERLGDAAMIGAIYTVRPRDNQLDWVRAQPWYNGLDPAGLSRFSFATGGWWLARTTCLYQLNYPWPELDHRGGDVMLGEAMRQQGWKVRNFNSGVAINADDHGRECKSPRRGYDSQPIGTDYQSTDVPRPIPNKIIQI